MKELSNTTWGWFDLAWPWIGLAAACIFLYFLFATNKFRRDSSYPKWCDGVWLSWLSVPIYMLYQFEEYGIDMLGEKHAFPGSLCNNLKLGDYPACTIPHEFFLYVNIPLVWIFGILGAMLSRKHLLAGLGLYGIMITNAGVHMASSIINQSYNPGVFSAVSIFLVSFTWMVKVCFGRGGLHRSGIVILLTTGIFTHVILLGSLFLFIEHRISRPLLDGLQVINASMILLIPLTAGFLINKYQGRRIVLPIDQASGNR